MVTLSALLPGGASALDLAPLLQDVIGPGARPFDELAEFAGSLPPILRGPDATPSLPTGASDVGRAEALALAGLAAVPRLVETFGARASGVVVGGETFAVAAVYGDPDTGFDAVQLRSLLDGRAVFAVDGTDFNSPPDVVAGLTLARTQVASPAFAAMVADAATAALAEGREVAFTGASLGGALVQVAGYETAEAIRAASAGAAADRVTVFTLDALGGRDAAQTLNGGRLDPAVLERLDAVNVRTEGDIVSRIGSDLGGTLTLRAVNAAGEPVVLSAQDAHVNFPSLFANLSSDALFAAGTRGDPGEIGGLTLLANTYGAEVSDLLLSDPALSGLFNRPTPAGPAFGGTLDLSGRFYDLDVNQDGAADLRVLLEGAGDTLIA